MASRPTVAIHSSSGGNFIPVYMGARFLTVLRRELELAPSARCPYGPHPSGHCGSYPQCVVELPAPE